MEKLFQLLTEHDETLVLKTLGLIRNLISSRAHIDLIMTTSGTKIIQAVVMILESDYYNVNVKEQALCILSNVADGLAHTNQKVEVGVLVVLVLVLVLVLLFPLLPPLLHQQLARRLHRHIQSPNFNRRQVQVTRLSTGSSH